MTQTALPPADPTAVVGRRVVAYLIDGVILVALMVALFVGLASSEDQGSAFQAELVCDVINNASSSDYVCIAADTTAILISNGDLALIALLALLYGFVTQMLLPSITGFSPGKAMVGLRIVNQESFQRAGIGANLVRWLLWIVDSAPWCFPLVGLITGLSSNGHRRVGDMAAKTVVIDKKWVGQPLAIAGVNSVSPLVPPPATAAPFGASPPPPTGSTIGAPTPPPPQPQGFPSAPPVAPPAPTPPTVTPPPPSPSTFTPPPPSTAPIAPPAMPPEPAPEPSAAFDATSALDATTAFEPEVILEPEGIVEPETMPEPEAVTAPPPPPPPAPPAPAAPRPGIDAPQWDVARDTYIQWDPELSEWMEWSESAGAWIPISR